MNYVHVTDGELPVVDPSTGTGDGDPPIGLIAESILLKSSPLGVGGASFRGGIRSLIASNPLASANDLIL